MGTGQFKELTNTLTQHFNATQQLGGPISGGWLLGQPHQAFNSSMCELPVSQVTSLLESQMDDIHELWHFGTMMNKIHCLFQRASCSALLLVGRGLDNPDGFE